MSKHKQASCDLESLASECSARREARSLEEGIMNDLYRRTFEVRLESVGEGGVEFSVELWPLAPDMVGSDFWISGIEAGIPLEGGHCR
jgi:hypothetical protein